MKWISVLLLTLTFTTACSSGNRNTASEVTQTGDANDSNLNQSCIFNGMRVNHNTTVDAYSSKDCKTAKMQKRLCNNGQLMGDKNHPNEGLFMYSCASCLFNAKLVPSGTTVDAYSSKDCKTAKMQKRLCLDGVLMGDKNHPDEDLFRFVCDKKAKK